jgi:hypothetical protein
VSDPDRCRMALVGLLQLASLGDHLIYRTRGSDDSVARAYKANAYRSRRTRRLCIALHDKFDYCLPQGPFAEENEL